MAATLSAGHGEYMISPPPGLVITDVWPPNDDELRRGGVSERLVSPPHRHRVAGPGVDWCGECGQTWPCPFEAGYREGYQDGYVAGHDRGVEVSQ